MKLVVVAAVLAIAAFLSMSHMQARSLWCAGVLYSRLELKRALKDLEEYGELQKRGNPTDPFAYTNSVEVEGTNYMCVAAYEDRKFYGRGFLAVTTNEVFIFVDRSRKPFIIPKSGCP